MWNLLSRPAFGLFFICLFSLGAFTANAHEVEDYVTVTEVPDWVKPASLPTYDPNDYADRESYYELVEWQSRHDLDDESFFARYAQVLTTAEGVEENANIHISFDPTFETVELHYVRVRRDGKYIDKTDLSEFVIYRKETDQRKLIFDGTLEMSYIVPDVRAGDMLEYAFTQNGRNPAFGPHFSVKYQQSYNDILLRFVHRVLVHEDVPVKAKSYADAKPPTRRRAGAYEEYYWDLKIPKAVASDSDVPGWYDEYPVYRMSSFENWKAVGEFFNQYYDTSAPLPAELAEIRKDIVATHNSDKDQTRAALGFVQANIRYFGIELGVGGYEPRPADKVMRRRYGDCKDMALLLVTLLRSMDIEAYPLLVDSENRQVTSRDLPRHTAFDHVVVWVKIGAQSYVLDPTKGEQLGDLDHLQQGDYGQGVIIAEDSPGLIELEIKGPEFLEIYHDSYDLVSQAPDILFTSESTYFQSGADDMISWKESSGIESIEREYLEFYQDGYPTIEQVGDMTLEVDEDKSAVTITVKYIIHDDWEFDEDDGRDYFTVYTREMDSEVEDFIGSRRIGVLTPRPTRPKRRPSRSRRPKPPPPAITLKSMTIKAKLIT